MDSFQRLIQQACTDSGDVSFIPAYSGRGMYGKRCLAISGNPDRCKEVLATVVSSLVQDVFNSAIHSHGHGPADEAVDAYDLHDNMQRVIAMLFCSESDSMGLGEVMYWPDSEPVIEEPLTNEWIDQRSEIDLLKWVEENKEYHTDEDNVETLKALRSTVRLMRDRMIEDLAEDDGSDTGCVGA